MKKIALIAVLLALVLGGAVGSNPKMLTSAQLGPVEGVISTISVQITNVVMLEDHDQTGQNI